jgi:glyoxylase-like metal-dependent hydrolase (beta-lactamase superfamily II)
MTEARTEHTEQLETWWIGDVRVTRLVEMETVAPPEMVCVGLTVEDALSHKGALADHVTDDGWLNFSIHGLVVDDGDQRILVDGGVGDGKPRPAPWFDQLDTRWIDRLAAAGFGPDTIDTVVATHVHLDHVGWMTRADGDEWVPSFPRARHLVVASELDHWLALDGPPADGDYIADSIAPVLAAGLLDRVGADAQISGHLRLIPTPGHTPGHVSVVIESGDDLAVITGDLLHHPIQVVRPELASPFDVDADLARRTRSGFVDTFADTGALVIGTHFSTPSAGTIDTLDGRATWQPRRSHADR